MQCLAFFDICISLYSDAPRSADANFIRLNQPLCGRRTGGARIRSVTPAIHSGPIGVVCCKRPTSPQKTKL